jgi:hypothetical protein
MLSFQSAPGDMDADELHLAQLACVKLVKLLQGTLSIGLPSLVTGVPEPQQFLRERFRVMEALAIVLGTVAGRPVVAEAILQLKQYSDELQAELQQLHRELLSAQRTISESSPDSFGQAKDTTGRLFEIAAALARFLKIETPLVSETKGMALQLLDATLKLSQSYNSDTRQPCG